MSNNNQHKPGYKHAAHFGWIPNEWHFEELGKKIDLLSGFAFESEKYTSTGTRLLRGANIKRGDTDWSEDNTTYWINVTPEIEKYLMQEGDLVIAMDGSLVGRSYAQISKNDLPCLLLQRVARIRSGEMDLTFLKSIIGSNYFIRYCDGVKTVTAIPHISSYDIKKFKVPVPCICEQRKIAAILSTWDEAITKTQQLIAQLQQRNKGLMQQLLTPKDDWSEKKLSEIFDRVVRKNTNGNTNVITISAQRGFVKQNDFFKKLVASETLDNYFLVRKGEFCYNKSYSNGYDWGATKRLNDFDEAVVTTLYICFRIKDEKEYSGDYFQYFFDANILDRGLAKIAHEGGRAHGLLNVTPGDFFSLKIHVPLYDEQQKIFKILSAAKNEQKLYEQKLAALQQQKKGLMQKLLTGEVRVKMDN